MAVFDDGSGSALYVGGDFSHCGADYLPGVAKWNGSNWEPACAGSLTHVNALTVFDDGSGAALFAGGAFGVARRTPTDWTLMGPSNGPVYALAVYDDGQGPSLYAAGQFQFTVPGAPNIHADNIVKWNGTAWGDVGFGVNNRVLSLVVCDDGTGDALYAGGDFTTSGSSPGTTSPMSHIGKWDGAGWSALASGTDGNVSALIAYDDGSGRALYAGGAFTTAGGSSSQHVAKWTSTGWTSLAGGPTGEVLALAAFNDGTGRALYAGGPFVAGGAALSSSVTKWNGSSWSDVAGSPGDSTFATVRALLAFNDGSGKQLFVGGSDFPTAGELGVRNIAKWNGTNWSALGDGVSDAVQSLAVFDDGTGPALFAGGYFASAGNLSLRGIGKWNGSYWSSVGGGMTTSAFSPLVLALSAFDDGTGPALYAGGYFSFAGGVPANSIAKWNGSSWSALPGLPTNSIVAAITAFDDGTGPALYAGGDVTMPGTVAATDVVKWDGTNWTPLGSGLGGSAHHVRALNVFDDGTGLALYAGGVFSTAGGVSATNIAKWNGSSWLALGSAMTGNSSFSPYVHSIAVYDSGSGPTLVVGGFFTSIGGVAANSIAKWNGSVWSPLGSGLENSFGIPPYGSARAMAMFDDGTGSKLFVLGSFATAGGVAAPNIASWNGTAWSPLGGGLSALSPGELFVDHALIGYDDSSGPALYAAGTFLSALDSHDSFLAKWGCPFVAAGATYCTTTTTSNGCVPAVSASGAASASAGSGFTISIDNLESHRLGLVFYGIHGQLAAPWGVGGSSTLCVKAPTQRMHAYNSGGSTGLCNGLISEDWNLFVATHATALGQPFLGGETVWAQGWFRDPPAQKTTALSNALAFAVGP